MVDPDLYQKNNLGQTEKKYTFRPPPPPPRDIKPGKNDDFRTRWSLPRVGWDCKQMIIFPPVKEEMCWSIALHCCIWTNTICNSDKYILQSGQILFVIQINTYCNLLKYICNMMIHPPVILPFTSLHCNVRCSVLQSLLLRVCHTLLRCVIHCNTLLHFAVCVTLCYTLHWSDPWPLHEAWVLFWAAQLFWSDTP